MSPGFAVDIDVCWKLRLDGLGSSVTELSSTERHWFLKSSGFAGGLIVFVVESEVRDFQRTRSGDAVLELWSCLAGSTRARVRSEVGNRRRPISQFFRPTTKLAIGGQDMSGRNCPASGADIVPIGL